MIRICGLSLAAALGISLCVAAFCLDARGGEYGPRAPGRAWAEPAPVVTVLVDGSVYQVESRARTVGELLAELGIGVGPLDRTSVPPDKPVSDRMLVRVTRVRCRKEVVEEVIPARTTVLADPRRPAGYTKTLREGRDGLVRRTLTIWERDGQITRRVVTSEKVVVNPEDTVILRGTYGAPSRHGNWRTPLRMTATAYDPGPRSCGRHADGRTATGERATRGVVATDPRVIPMGTRLYIPGYGFAVAADRGSAIKGMRIDLCYDTYAEARRFGRRKVDVYILD